MAPRFEGIEKRGPIVDGNTLSCLPLAFHAARESPLGVGRRGYHHGASDPPSNPRFFKGS